MQPTPFTNSITDNTGWQRLLNYYRDCLIEEHRLNYIIRAGEITDLCRFPSGIPVDFLRKGLSFLEIQRASDDLKHFLVNIPQQRGAFLSVCLGYPFMVDFDGNVIPLLYVIVTAQQTGNSLFLRRESDPEINYAAIWQVLPGDKASGDIDVQSIFELFSQIELYPPELYFDETLTLLIDQIETLANDRLAKVTSDDWVSEEPTFRPFSVVYHPVLFHVKNVYTYHLLREIDRLMRDYRWETVPPALRQLLTKVDGVAYPQAPDGDQTHQLYVLPANDRQRQAVTAASVCPVTVVTGPPGTGKSQLIVNIVGHAVLKGETVLIASRNNRAVDVVYERFLGQVKYPGTVRTGRKEFRDLLPQEMQSVLSTVDRGSTYSNFEKIRQKYQDLLNRIDSKSRVLAYIKSLLEEQGLYRAEKEKLLSLLPDPVRASVRKKPFPLDERQSERLGTALRSLEEAASRLIEHREELVALTQNFAAEAANELEAWWQKSLAVLRLQNIRQFEEIAHFLQVWDSLQKAIVLANQKATLEQRVKEARENFEAVSEHLPPPLREDLGGVLQRPRVDQVDALRQSLVNLNAENERLGQAVERLIGRLSATLAQFPIGPYLLEAWKEPDASELSSETIDLRMLHRFFACEDTFLEAHQAGVKRASLQRQLSALEREKSAKLADFEQQRLSVEEQLIAARAQIPIVLLPALDQVDGTKIRANWKTWKSQIKQLVDLSNWANRVRNGKLSPVEHLLQIIFPSWATRRIQNKWRDLSPVAEAMEFSGWLDEPGEDASFQEWAEYIQGVNAFLQACWLIAHRQHLLEQQETYREHTDEKIAEIRHQLDRDETIFSEKSAGLPDALVRAMKSETWPYEPIGDAFTQELATAKQDADPVLHQYKEVIERLETLHREYNLSDSLQTMARSLRVEGEDDAIGMSANLRSLKHVLSLSAQFCDAVDALVAWRKTENELSACLHSLETHLSNLPDKIRNPNLISKPVRDEWLRSVQASLASLQDYLNECLQEWHNLQRQTISVVLENSLDIPALAKALSRARRDGDHLGHLTDPQSYEQPDQLLENLRLWRFVLRVWTIQSELSRLDQALSQLPPLHQVQKELEDLKKEQIKTAGELLEARWHQTTAQLDKATLERIHTYVDMLSAGKTSRRRDSQEYFNDVLKLFPIWLTTNLSTQDLPLRPGLFDIVVIDEASQCDIPSALPLLFRGKRLVIIGDENQLTHIATLPDRINRKLADQHKIGERYNYQGVSLFRLSSRSVAKVPGHITLTDHYRSHEEIIQFANENFYENQLRIHTDLSDLPPSYYGSTCGIFWIQTKGRAERPRPKYIYNLQEIQTVVALVEKIFAYLQRINFTKTRNGDIEIGIVTPFRAQAEKIEEALEKAGIPLDHILVGTVHTYQGNERDIMIFSTTLTDNLPEETRKFVLLNQNLLNVAVTRARWSLFVVGDHDFFIRQPMRSPYYALAEYVQKRDRVYPSLTNLPFLQVLPGKESHVEKIIRPQTPYSNRMFLRHLLASCEQYIWWYDPYMTTHALDALALALSEPDSQVREIRLLTSQQFWENPKERLCLTVDAIKTLSTELKAQGIDLKVAVTSRDSANPPPHDRFLFSANFAVNMPPIRSIHETSRLAEFLPSRVRPEEFMEWWQRARQVYP